MTLTRARENYVRVQLAMPEDEGRTHQSFAEDADINKIMGKWRREGFVNDPTLPLPRYGDFSTTVDYQKALDQVMEAEEVFMSLPARVRSRVDNDPGKFIDFVNDPANGAELEELGLKDAPKPRPDGQGEKEAAPAAEPAANNPPPIVGGE